MEGVLSFLFSLINFTHVRGLAGDPSASLGSLSFRGPTTSEFVVGTTNVTLISNGLSVAEIAVSGTKK